MTGTRMASLMLAFSVAVASVAARADDRHISCSVAMAPAMEFGQPTANPTLATDTTSTVTVDCNGNGTVQGTQIKVCLLATPDPLRAMRNGASALRYELFRDSSHTQPLANPASGLATQVTLGQPPAVAAQAVFTVYGRIPAGQVGLAGGAHVDTVPLQVRAGTNLTAGCDSLGATVSTQLVARAQLASGSCTIKADDLRFGSTPSLSGSIDATASLGVTCTDGTAYRLGLGAGTVGAHVSARQMGRLGGGGLIGYQLYRDAARGIAWGDDAAQSVSGIGTGTPGTHTVFGRVPAQDTPLPGEYRDTVTATITY